MRKGTPREGESAGWLAGDGGVPRAALRAAVRRALEEDLPWGDLTSEAVLPPGIAARVVMVARAEGVVAGLPVAAEALRAMDEAVEVTFAATDGQRVAAGTPLLRAQGDARSLLMAERVALNFVQRLSGTATLTAAFVERVKGTGAVIVDTRKTTPGLRIFEKYAVRCGGGRNHRMGLSDAVLVKDNHRDALRAAGVGLTEALRDARRRLPHTVMVEVEVESEAELDAALAGGADIVLLDNMSPAELRRAVARVAGRARTEASGGISLETVRAVADSGVDMISVGALTHSAPALDVALDWETVAD